MKAGDVVGNRPSIMRSRHRGDSLRIVEPKLCAALLEVVLLSCERDRDQNGQQRFGGEQVVNQPRVLLSQ